MSSVVQPSEEEQYYAARAKVVSLEHEEEVALGQLAAVQHDKAEAERECKRLRCLLDAQDDAPLESAAAAAEGVDDADAQAAVSSQFSEDDARAAALGSPPCAGTRRGEASEQATPPTMHTAAGPSSEVQLATVDTDLLVPYDERGDVKPLGARWNDERKIWYAPAGVDLAPLAAWTPGPRIDLCVPFAE